ncbi:hypothetical protein [Fodinibius saliphilus]|uniref:hypothetical protein n=1 Tax=Fodinibius saliphilus TaxID=1920650 RepID=UPI00110882C0|nr:hypothetical protein [Fodinibius saliphilus]
MDSNKTTLSGYAGELSFGKLAGNHWRGSLSYSVVSPGYEVNEIGPHALSYFLAYRETSPKLFRIYNMWVLDGYG